MAHIVSLALNNGQIGNAKFGALSQGRLVVTNVVVLTGDNAYELWQHQPFFINRVF